MKTTFKKFLAGKGIKMETTAFVSVVDGCMRQPDLLALVDEFTALSTDSNKDEPVHETASMICVKNIDCDLDDLRNRLDKICIRFTIEKDTFIFYNADADLFKELNKLKGRLENAGKSIVVEKA